MVNTEIDKDKLPIIDDIHKYMEELKQRLKPLLKEELFKNYCKQAIEQKDCETMKTLISDYLKENTNIVPEEHIHVEVTATPEQIEKSEMTVTFIALDEEGIEFIKDMNNGKIIYAIDSSSILPKVFNSYINN